MITLNDARSVIAAAEKKATEIGQLMNMAVADNREMITLSGQARRQA